MITDADFGGVRIVCQKRGRLVGCKGALVRGEEGRRRSLFGCLRQWRNEGHDVA